MEHIWDELGRQVQGAVNTPANVHQLFLAFRRSGVAIPVPQIHNMILQPAHDSMLSNRVLSDIPLTDLRKQPVLKDIPPDRSV